VLLIIAGAPLNLAYEATTGLAKVSGGTPNSTVLAVEGITADYQRHYALMITGGLTIARYYFV